VPQHCGTKPADTYIVGVHPATLKVPRAAQRNSDKVFHIDGLGPCILIEDGQASRWCVPTYTRYEAGCKGAARGSDSLSDHR
jgi:hypothetical protein